MLSPFSQRLPATSAAPDDRQMSDAHLVHHDLSGLRSYLLCQKDTTTHQAPAKEPTKINKRPTQLDAESAQCSIFMVSMRRLPADVLSEIFVNVPNAPNSSQRNKEVLALCQISSWWRYVAFSTPHLWTALSICLPNQTASYEAVGPIKDFASEWFGRTGTILPLALRIQVNVPTEKDDSKERPDSCLKLVQSIIKPFVHRLKHLDLDSWFIYSLLIPFLSQSVPYNITTSLILRAGKEERYPIHQRESPDPPRIFPKLKRVKFERDLLATEPPFFPLPWGQLTHVTVNYLPSQYWIDLLSMCPNLEFGDFNFPGDVYDHVGVEQDIITPIPLHNLKELVCTFMESFDPYVFYRLDMPGLTTLRLGASAEDDQGVWMWRREPSDVFHAISSVRRMALIKEWPLCTYMFTMLLTHAPQLKELELQLDSELHPLLEVLQADPFQKKHLVPYLQFVTIDVVNFYEYSPTIGVHTFPIDFVASFLQSRRNGEEVQRKLERFVLYFPDRKDPASKAERRKIFSKLRDLKEPKFDVSLLLRHRGNHKGWRGRLQDFHSSKEAM
ncbi:hypothetical protein CPB83DRAFT_861398 [Crepidotus variabilis]|uniref:F-box domain-containing protein n=1 Tax=Crepidotus variabilis TaxID=179855 RepID=A0A9P6JL35_9AGAR|nr:hypothetical protein CPB83DRAFT_861398 [Crepidotus variabilis]